jgi:hypothetical protein
VVAGRMNRGAPSSYSQRSAAASVSLLDLQVRNDVTIRQRILFATDGIHPDKSWRSSSSSAFFKRWSCLIMGSLDVTNAFVTYTTLELSTQILDKDILSFFTRSISVLMSTIRIALSYLAEMNSALFFHSHIPWSSHCQGSPGLPATSSVPSKPTSAASVCIIPLVGSVRIERPSISVPANFLHIRRSLID